MNGSYLPSNWTSSWTNIQNRVEEVLLNKKSQCYLFSSGQHIKIHRCVTKTIDTPTQHLYPSNSLVVCKYMYHLTSHLGVLASFLWKAGKTSQAACVGQHCRSTLVGSVGRWSSVFVFWSCECYPCPDLVFFLEIVVLH